MFLFPRIFHLFILVILESFFFFFSFWIALIVIRIFLGQFCPPFYLVLWLQRSDFSWCLLWDTVARSPSPFMGVSPNITFSVWGYAVTGFLTVLPNWTFQMVHLRVLFWGRKPNQDLLVEMSVKRAFLGLVRSTGSFRSFALGLSLCVMTSIVWTKTHSVS